MNGAQHDLFGNEIPPPPKYGPKDYHTRHKRALEQGKHPLTGVGLVEGYTCKTCRFARMRGGMAGRYWKCMNAPLTGGPATDLRLGWPACMLYESGETQRA